MNLKLSDKAKGVIAAIAPTIGTALGGPLGGMAAQVLVGTLGVDASKVDATLCAQTPEALLQLKQAEDAFIVRMRELDIQEEDLQRQDTADARAALKVVKWPQIILGYMFVLGYFGVMYEMLQGQIQIADGIKEVAMLMLGQLVREVGSVMHFWFGTTLGSKSKDAILGSKV